MLHVVPRIITCIFCEWLIIFFVLKQGHGDGECGSFVEIKSNSRGRVVNISLDPLKWGPLNTDVRSCTIDISFSEKYIVRYLEIDMKYSETTTNETNPACFFISKYDFLVYKDMKPAGTLLCSDVEHPWYIQWPFESAFLRIRFATYYPRPLVNLGYLLFEVNSTSSFGYSYRQSIPSTTAHIVNFPHETFMDTCLKYGHEYKIIYKWSTIRNHKQHYQFRMLKSSVYTAFCLDARCHAYCTNRWGNLRCGMTVDVFTDGERIMRYDCLSTYGYWCLPPAWTYGHEFIDVVVTSIGGSYNKNSSYEVLIATNSSRPTDPYCVYKQTTTTATTTTTPPTTTIDSKQPWSIWSPQTHEFEMVVRRPYFAPSNSSNAALLVFPVVAVALFSVIVFIVVYCQYMKRTNSPPTNSRTPNAHNAINSISNNSIMTQDASAIPLRMINPSQGHTVSDGRTQNYQVHSRNLNAQSTGMVQVPTSNNPDKPTRTSDSDLNTNTASVVTTSQQEPQPPTYSPALNMVIVPCYNQN